MRIANLIHISDPTFHLGVCAVSTLLISGVSPRLAVISILAGLVFSRLGEKAISTSMKDKIIRAVDSYWPLRFIERLAILILRFVDTPADDIDSDGYRLYLSLFLLLEHLNQNSHSRLLQRLIAIVIVGMNIKFGNLIYRMNNYYRN